MVTKIKKRATRLEKNKNPKADSRPQKRGGTLESGPVIFLAPLSTRSDEGTRPIINGGSAIEGAGYLWIDGDFLKPGNIFIKKDLVSSSKV